VIGLSRRACDSSSAPDGPDHAAAYGAGGHVAQGREEPGSASLMGDEVFAVDETLRGRCRLAGLGHTYYTAVS
jgi:hypothetical protein